MSWSQCPCPFRSDWLKREMFKVYTQFIRPVFMSFALSTTYSKDQIDIWSERQTTERFAKLIAMKDTVFLVVGLSPTKEEIGFGHMGKCSDSRFSSCVDYEVYGFYISPAFGRQGVGKALLTELENRAVELGCKGHIGICATLNAVPFYTACGYNTVRDSVHCLEGACVGLECKIMEKQLQST